VLQADVDAAPTFIEAITQFREWLVNHRLICPRTERKLQRFMWCTDGPFDIRDFVVKQCFISNVRIITYFDALTLTRRVD
jgi:3'-5' exoribonuclease 1